jgi:P27 family predicted phage terminase small subunit
MKPPTWLSPWAKRYWRKYAKIIQPNEANKDQIAMLVDSLSTYRQAATLIQEEGLLVTTGSGCLKRNPAVDIQKQCFSQIVRLQKILGLIGTPDLIIEDDELDELLG